MSYIYNDGGRKAAGYKGNAGDCVTRAVAIATGLPYLEVYDTINQIGKQAHEQKVKRICREIETKTFGKVYVTQRGRKAIPRSRARSGVFKKDYKGWLQELGWRWTPTMQIGQGCKVHLRADELPSGTIIVQVSKHLVTVIDGVIQDTFDPSRGGTRCVYGYWSKQ